MIGVIVVVFAVSALLIYLLVKDKRIKREINDWLVDAVKLRAFCEECDKRVFVLLANNVDCVGNVKVTFKYKDDKKVLRSNLYSNSRGGTGTVFTRFVNKEIYIMYSPKYRQVMFLDEPCEQSCEIQ